MKKQFIVLLFGDFALAGANGNTLRFASEQEAHDVMEVNFPFITDYKVVKRS